MRELTHPRPRLKANESSEVYPPDILDVTPDSMGFSVAIGEIDGLPGPEIVVGAPSTWIGSNQSAGAVYVFQGNAAGGYSSANHIFLQPMDAVGASPDPEPGANFGWDVAIGDIDGDGINDVVVGEPGYDTFGAIDTGRVQVFFGPTLTTSEWVLGSNAYTFSSLFGYSVAVGQLGTYIDPNPNKNELIIGAPHGGLILNSGELFVYERNLNPPPNNYFLVTQGQSPNPKLWGLYGWSVATGRLGLGTPSNCDDVIVGAPAEGGLNRPWGRVYYYYDWCNTPITTVTLDPVNFLDFSAGRFGAVVAAGDVDGNGFDDVVVGDDFREFVPGLTTWAVTLHNPSGGAWTEVRFDEVVQRGDSPTMSLAVGDLDDDGWEDLVIGTPFHDPCGFWTEDAGEVHAILLKDKFGIPGGLPLNKDYRYFFDNHSFAAPPIARVWLGWAVAAGDIDGNSGDEIVIGATGANLESNHGAGKIIVRTLEP